jgi:hypothetical protein
MQASTGHTYRRKTMREERGGFNDWLDDGRLGAVWGEGWEPIQCVVIFLQLFLFVEICLWYERGRENHRHGNSAQI